MKRLLHIFELSKNEQRVVLIVMLVLVALAGLAYQRRVHRSLAQLTSAKQIQASPTPVQTARNQ